MSWWWWVIKELKREGIRVSICIENTKLLLLRFKLIDELKVKLGSLRWNLDWDWVRLRISKEDDGFNRWDIVVVATIDEYKDNELHGLIWYRRFGWDKVGLWWWCCCNKERKYQRRMVLMFMGLSGKRRSGGESGDWKAKFMRLQVWDDVVECLKLLRCMLGSKCVKCNEKLKKNRPEYGLNCP